MPNKMKGVALFIYATFCGLINLLSLDRFWEKERHPSKRPSRIGYGHPEFNYVQGLTELRTAFTT